jgi:hypothetical protein
MLFLPVLCLYFFFQRPSIQPSILSQESFGGVFLKFRSIAFSFFLGITFVSPNLWVVFGIWSMASLNNAVLARLGWKMVSNQPLLWVDSFRGKYIKNGVSFLHAPPNPLSSWLWKRLLSIRRVVMKGACISIPSGRMVDVWKSLWIPSTANFRHVPNVDLVELPDFLVADLILLGERAWNKHLLEDLDPLSVQCILSIHLPVCLSGLGLQPHRVCSMRNLGGWQALPSSLGCLVHSLVSKSKLGRNIFLWKVAWDILPSTAKIGRLVVSMILMLGFALFAKVL